MYIINITRHNRCQRQVLAGNNLEQAENLLTLEAKQAFGHMFSEAEKIVSGLLHYRLHNEVVELCKLDASPVTSKIFPVPAFGAEFETFSTGAAILRKVPGETGADQRAKFIEQYGHDDAAMYSTIKGMDVKEFNAFTGLDIEGLDGVPVLVDASTGIGYVANIPLKSVVYRLAEMSDAIPFRIVNK